MQYIVFFQLLGIFFSTFFAHLVTVACVEAWHKPESNKKHDAENPFVNVVLPKQNVGFKH